jgi:5-(carboxyamino)imidazole ribonucleotide mutase
MSKVAVIMGSISDMPVMQDAMNILKSLESRQRSILCLQYRTPGKLFDFSKNAHNRGIAVVIASRWCRISEWSMSPLPVIGVPVKSK